MPFVELLERLTADPTAFSVVLFDRAEWHYSPLVRQEIEPTEVADLGELDDAEDALAAAAADEEVARIDE
eukprot:6178044-Prymnesium_polylepis.1